MTRGDVKPQACPEVLKEVMLEKVTLKEVLLALTTVEVNLFFHIQYASNEPFH